MVLQMRHPREAEISESSLKRIGSFWSSVEDLYTSNEISLSQYLTQKELLKSVVYNMQNK